MSPAASGVVFRQARLADIDALFTIEQQSFRYDSLSRRSLLRLITRLKTAIVEVAVFEERVVGYIVVLVRSNSVKARIYSIAVLSEYQGKQIGKNLIVHAMAAIKRNGKSIVTLEVRSDNKVAIQLYESLGFQRVGTRHAYYQDGKAAILYQLKIL